MPETDSTDWCKEQSTERGTYMNVAIMTGQLLVT